jgi:hypothetical protein
MSEITYDGKFSNLEVDKLYTTEKTSSISSSLTLDKTDSGTIYFCDSSAANLVVTLPAATVGSGIHYRFIATTVDDSYYLRFTSSSNIKGVTLDYAASPPNTTLTANSGTTVSLITAGLNTFSVGSRIAFISDGSTWFLSEDQSSVPPVFS